MTQVHKSSKHIYTTLLILLLIGVASLISISCKSPESPDTEEPVSVAVITVTNDYGETLDVYLDGTFQFVLANQGSDDIGDLSLGLYRLEAKKVGTGQVVEWYDIDITSLVNYTWIIDDPSDINIVNQSGIPLKIYMNGSYQFSLMDEENRWILDVSRDEHLLRADRVEDDAEYASTTLTVTRNADYSWVIE